MVRRSLIGFLQSGRDTDDSMVEIGCSADEQANSTIVACKLSGDVTDVTSKDNDNDHHQSSSSSIHLHKSIKQKLITRIFPPVFDHLTYLTKGIDWDSSQLDRCALLNFAVTFQRHVEPISFAFQSDPTTIAPTLPPGFVISDNLNDDDDKLSQNASLLDLHKTATINISNLKSKAKKESEWKKAVVWDHDVMMGVNSKLISKNQKADLIKDAKGLVGRFGRSSFL
ncbi:hypothetical protein PGT21_009289 [Puccinia graminis f. sp. tritici]|uniref:DUF3752 domain-containing protein n=1 Tax=Puccinia graminis f. sp. tritici TaxID=56615 RepID=A0A5B0Q5D0_PUCGR|nr:hypothetical protein PGT21_009289 [Puccinia graminis f. sp. tritici]